FPTRRSSDLRGQDNPTAAPRSRTGEPSPMKKIVIVTDAWHPQVNGVVRTLTKCHDLMIERGYDVTVVSPLDYRSVPCPTYPEIRLALTTPGALKRRLKTMQPDFVHIATE